MPENTQPPENLEQLRDEKCVPVARGMLIDMATDMVPEDANKEVSYTGVLLKFMQRSLDADLNIVMENPYVMQLILSGLAGLNTVVQTCTMTPTDDARYGTIAKKMLSVLATANVPLVASDPKARPTAEQMVTDFAPIKDQVQAIITENNLTPLEVTYIMENIFTSFQSTQGAFAGVVASHVQNAEAKLFGLDSYSDLSMKKLDAVLTDVVPPASTT